MILDTKELKAALKAALLFASKDITRPHLCGAHFKLTADRLTITSTDGHTLARVKIPARAGADAEFTVAREALERLIKVLPRAGNTTLTPQAMVSPEGYVGVAHRHAGVLEPLEGLFPNADKVIPAHGRDCLGAVPVGVDPKYLARVGKAASLLGIDSLRMQTAKELDPIRFDGGADGVELLAIVMPRRLR